MLSLYSRQIALLEEETALAHRNRLLSILNHGSREFPHDSPKISHSKVISPLPRLPRQSFSNLLGKPATTPVQNVEISGSFALLTPSVENATSIGSKQFGPIGSGRLRPITNTPFTVNSIISVGLRKPFGYYSIWDERPGYPLDGQIGLSVEIPSITGDVEHYMPIFHDSQSSPLDSPQPLSSPTPSGISSCNSPDSAHLPGHIEMLLLLINGDKCINLYVASRIFRYCVTNGVHQTISVLVDRLLHHGVVGHPDNVFIADFIAFFVNMVVGEPHLVTPNGVEIPPPTPSQICAAFTAHFRKTWLQVSVKAWHP